MAGNTFTTYLNAKRTGSVDAEFAALDQRATKTLSNIQAKADAASRSMAGLTAGRGTGGRSPISAAYLNGFDQAQIKADRLREAQARLARENSSLVRGLRTTGTTLQVVQGPLGPIAGRVNAAADAIANLTGVTLGLAGAGAALFAYTSAANRFVEIRSKLAPLYDTQTQVNDALADVAGIALRARTGLEPIVDLYSRMKLAADQFGISQERVSRLTELATKAAALSGGNQQSREAGLYQFAQGFGSGSISGDELKSVRENTLQLARSLSEGLGKLPDFKGVDTSIGKLKELGAEGKLTADVIARALEASAGSIEAAFAKLPPTVGSAFTALQTNATLFIGRIEQATGIVGGLAQAILVVGNNLGPLVSIVGGLAAAWLAVAAAQRAGNAVDSISKMVTTARAQATATRTALEVAAAQRTATVQSTIALNQQNVQIRANIVALEREMVVQKEIAAQGALAARVNPAGGGRRIAAEANVAIARTTKQLAGEIDNLSRAEGEAARTSRLLAGQTRALDIAKQGAARGSTLLRRGLFGLLGAINPLGIAVAIATTAFLAWAQAESEAEKNAKKVEDAQRSLATVIDFTTGKIIEQNAALLAGARLNAAQGAAAAKQNYDATRERIASLAGQFSGQQRLGGGANAVYVNRQVSATQARARDALQSYGRNEMGTGALIQTLDALAKADPSLRGLRDQVTQLGSEAVETARKGEALRASVRLLAGATDAETRRRAGGDFSGGAAQGEAGSNRNLAAEAEVLRKQLQDRRFAAGVNRDEGLKRLEERRSKMGADDYVRERAQILASYDSEIANIGKAEQRGADRAAREEAARERKHQRELARIEAENQKRAGRTERRRDILDQYREEPKAIVKAQDQIRELNRLVGKTMDGLTEITDANPLGQGIYTPEMAAGDAARIQEGLQRPYNEYMEARQRDLNIQELVLAGRELEAEALRQAYDLYDDIGQVTTDQYQSILANLEAEQRINDALAQRERLLAPLKDSVEALRGSISGAIEDFLNDGNIFKSGKNLFSGLLKSFNKGTAEQLTAQITGGLDKRVRDLISGSTQVDGKIAEYLSALDTTGSATASVAEGLNNAADAANSAASALSNVQAAAAGGPAGGAAGALGAAVSAVTGGGGGAANSRLPSSFYKSGVSVGGGIGDNVIFKALGSLGGVITENLRPQSRQDAYFRAGLTPARVSQHTTTDEAFDVRLPKGMSFAQATALIRKAADEMGVSVVKAIDETSRGGTGRHGHYVFGRQAGPGTAARAETAIAATIGGTPASIAVSAIKSVADLAEGIFRGGKTATAGGVTQDADGTIAITGPSRGGQGSGRGGSPSLEQIYNASGREIGDKLDSIFGSKFFGKLGGQLGTALKGAQTGVMVSGVAKAFGLRQSKTGAAIGGGIGSVAGTALGGPVGGKIGAAVGGLIGGTIGGRLKENKFNFKAAAAATLLLGPLGGLIAGTAFAKAKRGSVTLGAKDGEVVVGQATGNSGKYRKVAEGLGGGVSDLLSQVAQQLDATLGSFSVSIGKRKGKFVVDPSGRGGLKTGVQKFDTEEEAVRAALMDAIKDGAIMGLSAAGKALLSSGKSLEAQMRKVQIIESIPKRLMAIKDPVRFAVTELNREFSEMIRYLKEGGATAAQFSEAQELYDLERADAIKQATEQTTRAIQDMIDGMLGGSNSPLNRRTVYDNAQQQLGGFAADVQAGKAVDTDAFLRAVANFQDASRELNGSNSSFFADFDYLLGLLNRSKENVVGAQTPAGELPASPFSDAVIQQLITGSTGTTDAVNVQTQVLGGLLGELLGRFQNGGAAAGSAIDGLPSGGYGGGYYGGGGLNGRLYNQNVSLV